MDKITNTDARTKTPLAASKLYFIGIGGIGMSALARYFVALGKRVSG